MSDSGPVVKIVAVVLLAVLIGMFTSLAIDMLVPAITPGDLIGVATQATPVEQSSGASSEAYAEYEAKFQDIVDRQERGEITSEQADQEMQSLAAAEQAAMASQQGASPSGSPLDTPALGSLVNTVQSRFLTIALVNMVVMVALLGVGILLGRRGVPMSDAPLLAGAFVGTQAMASIMATNTGWGRLLLAGLVLAAVIAAGLVAFRDRTAAAV